MRHSFSKLISRAALVCALTFFWCVATSAQQSPLASVTYRLAMSRPVSHLFEVKIEVELTDGASADYLDFQMPRWSPGRYSVFDFAKNVQEFDAEGWRCLPDAPCAHSFGE